MSPDKNPHFKHIERAPYELGHLLKNMPPDISAFKSQSADAYLMADAAHLHAGNGLSTLIDGLEALGSLMVTAGGCRDLTVGNGTVRALGALVEHISVEIQYLHETEYNMSEIVKSRDTNDKKEGAQ